MAGRGDPWQSVVCFPVIPCNQPMPNLDKEKGTGGVGTKREGRQTNKEKWEKKKPFPRQEVLPPRYISSSSFVDTYRCIM